MTTDFEHVDFGPPFTPDRYLESIRALAKRGFRAVVVDSMSHEWEGEGGVLEMADRDTSKPPSNWIKPKAAHKKLVNGLLQVGTNLDVLPARPREGRSGGGPGPRRKDRGAPDWVASDQRKSGSFSR